MKHFILGTAGHVDHGKSSLIKALTQVDTDRLPEEKARGLSIDLGFAPLLLEGEPPVHLGVVDVPGHHRFLRNMIAGVGGFDAALLVVDCCEGVKPQTEEHLKILELLNTARGVVALTKVDKSDEDGVEIARWELQELLQGTFLEKAPIIATSAHTGEGLDELKDALYQCFQGLSERDPQGVCRLPVDRSFSKTGFGDVVTGSLWSGTLRVGDEVEILPGGDRGKVRGLQVHGKATDSALPGQRVAVNISGLAQGVLGRGTTVVSPPSSFPVGERFAVSMELLEAEPKLVKKKAKATFFQGTSHHQISINLVADKESAKEVFGQLAFSEGTLLCRGDRFLLRDETDQRLLGGGTVLALEEKPFRRSKSDQFLKRYEALAGGGEVGRVLQYLRERGGFDREKGLKKHLGLSNTEWAEHLDTLLSSGQVRRLGKDKLWMAERYNRLAEQIVTLLSRLVESAPWKGGWSSSELLSLLQMKSGKGSGLEDVLEEMLSEGAISRRGPFYATSGHEPSLEGEAREQAETMLERLHSDLFSPRDWQTLLDETSADKKRQEQLSGYLFGTESVTRLSDKLVTTPSVMERARETLQEAHPEGFTASEARQSLDTSRKFIIPILEWMDQQGWSVRLGDRRKLSG